MVVEVQREGAARVVVINRPERKNALDPETLDALYQRANELRRDPGVRGVVLTGAEGAGVFLSGGDLQALAGVRSEAAAKKMARQAHRAVDALRALRVPLVAAVHGDAFGGGCELAAACDYRVCEEGVRFHWVQTRFAVTTGWGGTAHLLDLVPRGTVVRWLLASDPVTCAEAHAAGSVDEVVAPGEARRAPAAFLERVARHPAEGSKTLLSLVRESVRLDGRMARALELANFGRTWATTEHHEAVARFLAKRGK